jgi:hypothetical protein
MKEELTTDQILVWIINHQGDTDAMNKINRLSYQYTSKFLGSQNKKAAQAGAGAKNE